MADADAMVSIVPHEADEDPDAHATLREFVDYTEYLPSDLFRSLQLIRNLDAQEADHRGHLEWMTKEFANLPSRAPNASSTSTSSSSSSFASSPGQNGLVPGGQAQTANGFSNSVHRGSRPISDEEMEMRLQISRSINASIRTRQESAAEAAKLHQNIDRHYWRICSIRSKLDEITVPSRDPTPVSPRKPRVTDKSSEDPTHCRITLRLNSDRPQTASRGRRRGGSNQTPRARPPPVTPAGNEDDWEDIPDSVYPLEKVPKKKKAPGGSGPKRGPKPPTDPLFSGGAPARYSDGTPIPGHLLPWNRLTNEELARLRKRMKKNSGWTPSVTMIIRELESLGRGPKHKDSFLDQSEGRLGEDFLKIYGPEDGGIGDPEKIAPDDGAGVRENKGMRLNRAKKRKREEERREKEREAERERKEAEQERERLHREAEEAARAEKERIAREAREKAERERIAREAREAREAAAAAAAAAAAKEKAEKERLAKEAREEKVREKVREKLAAKERERLAAAAAVSNRKTRSASTSTTNTTNTTVTTTNTNGDEDEDMPDADAEEPSLPPPPPPPPRRLGRPPKNQPTFKPGHKRAASSISAGTTATDTKRSKRGTSSAVAPPPPIPPRKAAGVSKVNNRATKASVTGGSTATGRKKGLIAGRRRAAAKNEVAEGGPKEEAEEEWEDEDEDLNRYCLCDEVSRGTMVACENPQCPKVWFHIECVGLKEEEASSDKLKWYCPICKVEMPAKRGGKRRKKV